LFSTSSLKHGTLVMISADSLPQDLSVLLHRAELEFANTLGPGRKHTWIMGRASLRHAVRTLIGDPPALLVDHRGAPLVPDGLAGSISHKSEKAAALVALSSDGSKVGLDIEHAVASRRDISSRILCDDELDQLREIAPSERGRAVTLRFSIKEAIYKAIDPFVQRYVGFREVALQWSGDKVTVPPLALDGHWFSVEVTWQELSGFWISTALARRG
jgi:enterobactin synthetase component D